MQMIYRNCIANESNPMTFDQPPLVPGGIQVVRYEKESFRFAEIVAAILKHRKFTSSPIPLERLHDSVPMESQRVDHHGFNEVTRSLYETDEDFQQCYLAFIALLYREMLTFDFVFQAVPTIRVHFPGRMPDFYRGSDGTFLGHHTDGLLGHSHAEINCWLPLTACYGSATLQIATFDRSIELLQEFVTQCQLDEDGYHFNGRQVFLDRLKSDMSFRDAVVEACQPIPMRYGDALLFDSRVLHGTADNSEDITRISLDFRIIPLALYESLNRVYVSQGRSGRKFVRGDVLHASCASEISKIQSTRANPGLTR